MSSPRPIDWEVVLDRLSALYHAGDWRVPYLRDHAENPFQVLVGTILSQRTRDESTDVASALLFAKFPDANALASATPAQIEPLIRRTGFYRVKSRTIRACARELLDRFDGVVPRTLDELVTLPGVGPKTANCVLVFGYGLAGLPVDTHVHRIANRLGLVKTRTPEETEARLRRVVPERFWIPLNPILVQHGQNVCRPLRPRCEDCPIVEFCATGLALRDGRRPPRAADAPSRRAVARLERPGPGRRPARRPRPGAAGAVLRRRPAPGPAERRRPARRPFVRGRLARPADGRE